MFKLFFFTSSQTKLSNVRHICKNHQIDIVSFQEQTYRANYNEPRIDDHQKLLRESFGDALIRWKKEFKTDSGSQTFFIEDTSVIIHGLSDEKDIPGPNIKYWMQDANFEDVDKQLKEKGNDRRVTVQSDILLYLQPTAINKSEGNFAHFTNSVDGFFIDKEEKFKTNLLYPWLDNKTFNKWFTPIKGGKPLSLLPIEEADKFDFRKKNVLELLKKLNIDKKRKQLKQQLTLESFDEQAPIFIICGPTCTGKTTLAEYLSQTHNYKHIEASDFMHLAYYRRHGTDSNYKLINFAEQALTDMPEIVASQILDHVGESINTPLVISGFRNIKEIEWFEQNCLHTKVIPIYIHTDFQTRFKRCKKRAREDHNSEVKNFESIDKQQFKMGLEKLGNELEVVIENDKDKNDLYSQFENIFNEQLDKTKYYKLEANKKDITLQEWILLSLLEEYESKRYFTTTEISKVINNLLPKGQIKKEKDNVSRYFNRTYYPYYEISKKGKINTFRLSNTGYSLALQIRKKKQIFI